jgi:hypothetical protein
MDANNIYPFKAAVSTQEWTMQEEQKPSDADASRKPFR